MTREVVLTKEVLGGNQEIDILLDIPFESFRFFYFLDDTDFRATSRGLKVTRELCFYDNIQRSFYLDYFAGMGLKMQVLLVSNRLIGIIYFSFH